LAPDQAYTIREIGQDVGWRRGLAELRTRVAMELRPPIGVDKSGASRALIEGFEVGAFAVDDRGDLPAFAELARAVEDGRLHRAVRIGVHSSEAPPELAAAVDLIVDGPAG